MQLVDRDVRHAELFNIVDADAGAACVITTRIRNLAEGEVFCGLLSESEALALLLTSAGLPHLIPNPPVAAVEAVEWITRYTRMEQPSDKATRQHSSARAVAGAASP